MDASSQMKIKEILQSAMWADYDEAGSFPAVRPLLAHYTSIAVFEQMMGNDEIWFSNPLYMNDLEELRFGMIEGANAFRTNAELKQACSDETSHEKLIHHFNYLFNEFETKHAFHTYVMCLAQHAPENNDGLLSMWRGYGAGGSGVAIVFDTEKIEANETSPLIVGPVKYATSEHRRMWITEKIHALAEVLKGHTLTDDDLFHFAFYWIERLKIFSLFTKHIGFHEENEWRIVYMNERDPNGLLKEMHGYAITQRGAEPKLKLKIKPLDGVFSQDLSFDKIVERVILGPTTSTALAANAVKRILELKGKHALAEKIIPSSIPFRP